MNGFNNDKDTSVNENTISRLRNNLVAAIADQKVFPKIIVIVPGNDIINYFRYKNEEDVAIGYTKIIRWLMTEYDRMEAAYKEYLPIKAKKHDEPYFLWIQPPPHNYFKSREISLRSHFSIVLVNIASLHENTYALPLKKGWDPTDKHLYNRDEKCLTANGYIQYWQAVDKTVCYFNTLVLKKKKQQELKHSQKQQHGFHQYTDKYHWQTKQSSKSR